jgi:hypothetical protein
LGFNFISIIQNIFSYFNYIMLLGILLLTICLRDDPWFPLDKLHFQSIKILVFTLKQFIDAHISIQVHQKLLKLGITLMWYEAFNVFCICFDMVIERIPQMSSMNFMLWSHMMMSSRLFHISASWENRIGTIGCTLRNDGLTHT